jgi:hypothetical protein
VYDDISGITSSDNCISKLHNLHEKGFSKTGLTFKRNEGGLLIRKEVRKALPNLTIIAATKENTGAAYYKKK